MGSARRGDGAPILIDDELGAHGGDAANAKRVSFSRGESGGDTGMLGSSNEACKRKASSLRRTRPWAASSGATRARGLASSIVRASATSGLARASSSDSRIQRLLQLLVEKRRRA